MALTFVLRVGYYLYHPHLGGHAKSHTQPTVDYRVAFRVAVAEVPESLPQQVANRGPKGGKALRKV